MAERACGKILADLASQKFSLHRIGFCWKLARLGLEQTSPALRLFLFCLFSCSGMSSVEESWLRRSHTLHISSWSCGMHGGRIFGNACAFPCLRPCQNLSFP